MIIDGLKEFIYSWKEYYQGWIIKKRDYYIYFNSQFQIYLDNYH